MLDFTIHLAGPLSTMILGEMGAEVIKVEPPGRGSPERAGAPFFNGLSMYFMGTGWNKRSVTINLKTEEGQEIASKLASNSDVVVQNFRQGVAERLGIGYEKLKSVNKKLIYCSIMGFDEGHPYYGKPSFDMIAQALSGLVSLYADDGRRPAVPLSLVDITTGMIASQAILAALYNRERRDAGEHVKVSLFQSAMFLLSPTVQGLLQGLEHNINSFTRVEHVGFMGVFTDINGDLFAVEAPDDSFFSKMALIPELKPIIEKNEYATKSDRAMRWRELDAEIQGVFVTRKRDYWLTELDKLGVPCAPVLSVDEAFSENSRYLETVTDKKYGQVRTVGYPAKFSISGKADIIAPPQLGSDTDEVLSELGYDNHSIQELRSRGII